MSDIRVFVAMQFSKDLDSVYETIRASCDRCGVTPIRIDEHKGSGAIPKKIWTEIENATLMIADLTGDNANVYMEIGKAHGKKPIIFISQGRPERAPFDIRSERIIQYKNDERGRAALATELCATLRAEVGRRERVLTICSRKGGVGKTSSVINLGSVFAELGERVLLVDLDPQASLTSSLLESPPTQAKSVFHRLTTQKGLGSIVVETNRKGVSIVPGRWMDTQIPLRTNCDLVNGLGGVAEEYDIVLIDTPAATDLILQNALQASHFALIPSDFSVGDLATLRQYVRYIKKHQGDFDYHFLGIFASRYEPKSVSKSKEHVKGLLKELVTHEKVTLLKNTIRCDDLVPLAMTKRCGVVDMKRFRRDVIRHYRKLGEELLGMLG